MRASAPRTPDFKRVRGIDRSEKHQLDDVEWLHRELGQAAPGRESESMRLLLSRVTLNNMFQFSALLDPQGRMWDANQAALQGGGLVRSDIHGRPFWEAQWWQTCEQTKTELRAAIGRAGAGEFVRYDVDVIGGARGRRVITIDFNIAPVKNRDGAVRFLICEGRNVTEQRRLEAEVRRQREELAHLDQVKTQFFANVSHECRTPLMLMLGPAADALADKQDPLGPLQRQRIALLHRNGLRLLKLVNTLLDFSRIEAGRARAVFEATDLATLTADLASSFRDLMDKAGLRFTVDCPPLPEPVHVDRDMWEKIVLNLLSNAFKFTLEGEVVLQLRAVDGMARLTVRDSGVGIPEAALPRVFERFYRVEGMQGRTFEGSGIGLALVQALARLHGGLIAVQSKPGEGSVFTVSMPLDANCLPAERPDDAKPLPDTLLPNRLLPEAPLPPRTAASGYVEEALGWLPGEGEAPAAPDRRPFAAPRPRIVVTDDNGDMRGYLTRLLSEAGYEVETVADGRAALAAVRRAPPALVLSDVMMPDMDGFALLREIRADPATGTTPVLLLSARAGEEARVQGLDAGADDYIIKPFTGRELVARIEGVLRLARLREDKAEAARELLARALDLTEDRLSLALESARMGTFNWNLATGELDWTPMCKAIFGMEAGGLVTYAIFLDRLHPEDRVRVDALCRETVDPSIRALYDVQYRVIWPSGATRWILARGKAYFDGAQAVRFTGTVVDVTDQKDAEAHLRGMVNELAHRVKNTLAVVQSIIEQTFRRGNDIDGIRQSLGGRLHALANTHTLLTLSNWQSVDFASLVSRSIGQLVHDSGVHFVTEGPTLGLAPKAALALGLVLHELGVNAIKHGAWSIAGGKVCCRWRLEGQKLLLEWSESGMAGLAPPTHTGFGSQLVNRVVAYDIHGEARQTWRPEGLLYVLIVPVVDALRENLSAESEV